MPLGKLPDDTRIGTPNPGGPMRFSTSNFLPVVLVAITVSGCASNGAPYEIALMPAPDVYDDGSIDPFVDAVIIEQIRQQEIPVDRDRGVPVLAVAVVKQRLSIDTREIFPVRDLPNGPQRDVPRTAEIRIPES